jgi:hypothetical protein
MSTFGITDTSQLLDAVNYALSNLGQSANAAANAGNTVTINTTTGVIGEGGYVLSYLYRYLTIRYGTSSAGAGLTTNPVGATYFGVYNNNSTTPPDASNPGNYQWTQTTSALSATNLLWYSTLGGRQVQFYVGTQASLPQPASNWAQVNNATPSNVIDLDFVTATATLPLVVMTAYYNAANANVAPATPTGGTYDFGNLIFTAPAGWANSIPANNTAFFSSQNQFQSTASGNLTVGPVDPWTTPVLTGKLGTDGANGANGTNGANGVSTFNYPIYQSANATPATPTGGYWNFATSVGTPPTGWANVATAGAGNVIYVSSSTVSSNIANANVAVGTWSSPIAYSGTGAQGPRGSMPMAYIISNANPIGANVTSLNTWFAASPTGTPAGSNSAPIGTGFFPQTGDTAAFTSGSNGAQVAVLTYSSNTSPVWTSVVGNVINGNLFVTQSVNAGKLNANDVYTLNLTGGTGVVGNNSSGGFWMQASSGNARMAGSVSIGNLLTVGANAVVGGNLSIGDNANIGGNLVIGNNASIGGNLTVAGLITGNGAGASLNANTVITTTMVANAVTQTDAYASVTYVADIINPTANVLNIAGQWIGSNVSTSGTTLTQGTDPVSGQTALFLSDQFLSTSQVSKLSGTGTFATNTTIASVINNSQLTLSAVPTVALANAVVQSLGICNPNYRSAPGIYLTTTTANSLCQISMSSSLIVDAYASAMNAQGFASIAAQVYIIALPYTLGQTVSLTGSYIVTQFPVSYPIIFLPNVYSQAIAWAVPQTIFIAPTAGTWMFFPAVYLQSLTGTWTFDRLLMSGLQGSGTILKR